VSDDPTDRIAPDPNRDTQPEHLHAPDVAGTSGARGSGSAPLLSIRDLAIYYGNIAAVKGISLDVYEGEIVTLIGANGAGKSSTMRTISGLIKPRRGSIEFQGNRIDGRPGHDICSLGIAQSPEGRKIFGRMTVRENLAMGAFQRNDKDGIRSDFDRVFDLFPRLSERVEQRAGTMSGGEQQMLAMGRALMARPRLLLLDEPSMGLAPVLVELIFETVLEVNKQGTTVMMVEQNALAALNVAHYAYALEVGLISLEGRAKELASDPRVRAAYLGGH
jgi:branched-chain amino acid transport system ATP-binding protein